jgi:hypothetical protein
MREEVGSTLPADEWLPFEPRGIVYLTTIHRSSETTGRPAVLCADVAGLE